MLHLSLNDFSKPEDLRLQNATLLRKSAPGPPNSSDEHVSCAAPATENASLQILFKCPTPAIVFGNATRTFCSLLTRCTIPCACHAKRHLNVQKLREHVVFFTFWVRNVLRATTACTFSTSQRPKVVREWCALYILTSKCASRQNGVCALFRHLNFQKCFEREVFLAFSLAKALLATMACTFSTSQLPKVVRSWCVFVHLTSKCASHHNGVQFFISHLARWLRTRSFSEPTFRPSGATNHWKNTASRDFPTFSRTWVFFLLTLSLLWSSVFYSSLLSDSPFPSLLFICPFVGILISKLPSIIVLLKSHSVQGMDYTSIAGPDVRDSQALDWWKAQANCRGRNYWTKQLNFLLQIHCTLGKW